MRSGVPQMMSIACSRPNHSSVLEYACRCRHPGKVARISQLSTVQQPLDLAGIITERIEADVRRLESHALKARLLLQRHRGIDAELGANTVTTGAYILVTPRLRYHHEIARGLHAGG